MVDKILHCGDCNYTELNKDTLEVICTLKNEEVNIFDDRCDDYMLRDDILKENSCCGVCEYIMIDEYCARQKKYTRHNHNVCEDFEPCEEFLKGLL